MSRVGLFIVGVQKGGTTALDSLLRLHPQIGMAVGKKEPHHFDDEQVDWLSPDHAAYHRRFEFADHAKRVFGDATPIYIYWPGALERIRAYNPDARLVVCLRHPAHRAYSHWLMETVRDKETLPFAEAIRAGRSRVAASEGGVHRIFSYIERGEYGGQIERLLSLFSRESVRFIRTDDLWSNQESVLKQLHAFLELAPGPAPPTPTYVSIPPSGGGLPIPREEQAYITGLLAPEVLKAASLTGLDLGDWLDPGYREPMTAG